MLLVLRRLTMFGLAATVLFPLDAEAQQPDSIRRDTTVFRIEGIRIQAQRPVTTIGGASAVEVTVDSLGLPAAPTAEDILRELPSVHVRTNSRGQAEISVRGSESRQVAVLLDGVPLTLGWDARTDVSVLPAGAAQEVTFVRGLSSILHGPNVLGGVVEMNVARGSSFPNVRSSQAAASVDHLGGYATSASVTAPFETDDGRGMIRAGGGFRDGPGLPLADGIVEPRPDGDLRSNTDMQNVDGFLALRFAGDDGGWGSFSAASHRAERGIAAELGASDPRLWRYPGIDRTILALAGGTGERGTPWGHGDLEASVGVDFGTTSIESFETRAYDVVDGTEVGDARTATVRLLGDHTLGGAAELRSALTFADIHHDETTDGSTLTYQQRLFSAGVETVWRMIEYGDGPIEGLRLSVGAAYDRASTPQTGGRTSLGALGDWGARLGLSAVANDGGTLIHAGVSRRGRFPSLRETYSEALNRFEPNPDLMSEHLVAFETGVTSRIGNGEVQVVGFHHRLSDAIRRVTLDSGRRQRVNSEELRSVGIEFLASQDFGPFSVGGELTLQSVSLSAPASPGRSTRPENLPEQIANAYVRVPIFGGISATGEAEYTGAQFCQDPDSGADVELESGTWLNAVFSKVWGGGGRNVRTSVSATNLSDTALYDQCGLPRPGRLLRFQVQVF